MVICAGHTPHWCFQAPQVAAKGDAYVATILDRIFLHSVCSGLSSFIDTGATTSIMSKFGIIFVILFTAHAMCYCPVFTCPGHTHTLAESACTQSGCKYMISSEPSCWTHALEERTSCGYGPKGAHCREAPLCTVLLLVITQIGSRPLNSHSATMRLTVSAVISQSHDGHLISHGLLSVSTTNLPINTTGGVIDSRNTKTYNFGI